MPEPESADVVAGLRALRDLLADPDRWTQRANARDEDGCFLGPRDPAACRWCLSGGISKVVPRSDSPSRLGTRIRMVEALDAAIPGNWMVTEFNDDPDTTHADVLAAIDRAMAVAEKWA